MVTICNARNNDRTPNSVNSPHYSRSKQCTFHVAKYDDLQKHTLHLPAALPIFSFKCSYFKTLKNCKEYMYACVIDSRMND